MVGTEVDREWEDGKTCKSGIGSGGGIGIEGTEEGGVLEETIVDYGTKIVDYGLWSRSSEWGMMEVEIFVEEVGLGTFVEGAKTGYGPRSEGWFVEWRNNWLENQVRSEDKGEDVGKDWDKVM